MEALGQVVELSGRTSERERFRLTFDAVVTGRAGDGSGGVDWTVEALRTNETGILSRHVLELTRGTRGSHARSGLAIMSGRTLVTVRLTDWIRFVRPSSAEVTSVAVDHFRYVSHVAEWTVLATRTLQTVAQRHLAVVRSKKFMTS